MFDILSEDLTPINDLFRLVIFDNKEIINDIRFEYLNRLEQLKITVPNY